MNRRLPRRKRLMLRSILLGLMPLVAVSLVIYRMRWDDEPYRPGEEIEGITRSLDRELPQDYPRVTFQDVASQAGIAFKHFWRERSIQLPEDMGSGAAWGDYDGDGDWDLYVNNIAGPLTLSPSETAASPASNRLFRNNGDGTFTDVSEQAGVDFRGTSMASAWADYDDDGDVDLLVTNFGLNVLYENRGDGTFVDATARLGEGNQAGFWAGASWADYDRDGDLDLYICGYVRYKYQAEKVSQMTRQFSGLVPFTLNPSSYPPERNLLFRNEGGLFTEVAAQAGVENTKGRSLAASWADFDLDGWQDLYVANDISDNVLYRNLGNGRFEDVSHQSWVADYRGAMGLAVGDWDNDTDLEIFVTHWIAQENAFYNNLIYAFDRADPKSDRILFMDVADQVGLGQIALDYIGWGTSFLDYDNDGRSDLMVVNGSTFQDQENPLKLVPMRDLLFWNRGDEEGFFEVGPGSGSIFAEARVGRGAAFADYDDDGDVDAVIVNHDDSLWLLRNEGGNQKNWLKVRLRSGKLNRFGVGARIELVVGGQRQLVQIGSQPSYLSQNPPEAHFGLGEANEVDQIEVIFPDGQSWKGTRIRSNQTLVVEHP